MQESIPDIRAQSRPYAAAGARGIILAAVLILLGITVALAMQAQVLARSYLILAKAEHTRAQLRAAAADGAWHALNILAADRVMLIDHTNEDWAAPISLRLPDGIEIEISITDQNRRLDANMLAYQPPAAPWRPPAAVIRDLLASANAPDPDRRVEIIRDWLDENLEGDYEKAYYTRRESPFSPPNLPAESPEEMLFLLDSTNNASPAEAVMAVLPAQDRRIEPVNVNTADRATLLAVFGLNNAPAADRIIRGRGAVPILTMDQVLDPLTLKRHAPYLSVRSSFFSVHARAMMGPDAEDVYCLARRDASGNIQVVRWVER